MASYVGSTAAYAAADMSHYALGDARRKHLGTSGRKRRTVFQAAARPMFAAEAEFKASKVFTRSKKGMLALYGTDLQVVDVLALETAADASNADVTAHVLRWVNYTDLLEVSFSGPATLKIEVGDTSDKPKVRGVSDALAAASDDDMGSSHMLSAGGASIASSPAAPGSGASAATAAAALRMTSESFTLTFRDAGIAQRAAAALLFQQAQYAAVRHWLRMGLHAGFRCDLVRVQALPLLFADSQQPATSTPTGGAAGSFGGSGLPRSHSLLPPHVLYSCASGSYSRVSWSGSGAGGAVRLSSAGAAMAAGAAGADAAAYPWGSVDGQQWGCLVPLPVGWGTVLDAAAGSAGGRSVLDEEQGATPEELTCPVVLEQGPKALQVTISAPLGAAVATITPQLAKAALLHSTCREVLALPLHPQTASSSSSSTGAPLAAFTWSVQGNVPTAAGAAAAVEGSTGSSGNVSGTGLDPEDSTVGSVSSAGAHSSSSGLPLMHSLDVYAAVTVQVVRTPAAANSRRVGKIFDPEAQTAAAAAAPGRFSRGGATSEAAAPSSSSSSSSSSGRQASGSVQVQLAVCAVLAAIALQQSRGHLLLLLFQLLLVAALAAMALSTAGSGSSSSSSGSSNAGVSDTPGQSSAAGSSSSSSEDVRCCGWSIQLVAADLCSTPSRYLQLQVSLAKASRGMARLRLRMASMSAGGAPPVPLLAQPSEDDEEEEQEGPGLPVLVSEPEPIWLNTDTKQRFINAKPTLEASRDQALRTQKWRQQMGVDTVLMRPCPKFPLMCRLLPTYLLADESPDGHAVVLTKVGRVKDLCDAMFQTPEGSPEGMTMLEAEHTLALVNEYLVQIAAPKSLPAGFQIQIYDLAGFKLSYVMGDMMALFKMLVAFGLYYPERLRLALVINAPAWFSTPWRAMAAFLDENTSAKVVVVGSPKSALATLSHHLGGVDNVPAAWGGKCNLPLDEYPAHQRMMEFGRRLNAGEQPFSGLQRS